MTVSSKTDGTSAQDNKTLASQQKLSEISERLTSVFGDSVQLDEAGGEMRLSCKVADLLYVLKTVRDDPFLQFKQLKDANGWTIRAD